MLWFPWLFPSAANVFCWGGFTRRCCDTRVLSLWPAQAIHVLSQGSCRVQAPLVTVPRGGDGLCPCPASGTGDVPVLQHRLRYRPRVTRAVSSGCGSARGAGTGTAAKGDSAAKVCAHKRCKCWGLCVVGVL